MSIPISICMIRKALTDDKILKELKDRLTYNITFGSMLIWDCRCKERHKPLNADEMKILEKKLEDK